MIELPEAINISNQINDTISGKRIADVMAGYTPHKLAWYYGDINKYSELLVGKIIGEARAYGGLVEIKAGSAVILLGEGAGIRFHAINEPRPSRHQFLIEFEDRCALSAAVQMYGGMGAFREGELDNPYYKVAKEKPSPLSPEFNPAYFQGLISVKEAQKLSLKALLATEQRIPGLGNGVLQDILFNVRMHPKKKVATFSEKDKSILFNSIKETLAGMVSLGGRDTEFDLFGHPGGYKTILSKNTVNKPCPVCGTIIRKEAYMGGSIYFCENCQAL
jgi:formamidopyrimidine-DNA glycosylase